MSPILAFEVWNKVVNKLNYVDLKGDDDYDEAADQEDSDDEAEEPDGAAEDLHDEDLHEEHRVGRVGEGGTRTHLIMLGMMMMRIWMMNTTMTRIAE